MLSITSLILVILGLQLIDGSPITIPLVSDEHIDHVIPHYLENHPSNAGREPLHKAKPVVAEDIKHIEIKSDSKYCISDFKTRWVTELESPAFSTPVLFPASQSIEKLIFSSGYVKAVEMVNHEGYKPLGWPISFEQSTFQGSPILYDVDGDGNNDIGVVDKNGNMFWYDFCLSCLLIDLKARLSLLLLQFYLFFIAIFIFVFVNNLSLF